MTLNTDVNNPQLVPLPGLRPCRSCALPTRLSPPPWRPSSPPTPALTFTFCRLDLTRDDSGKTALQSSPPTWQGIMAHELQNTTRQ